jgi:hypothetical protein
LSSEREGRGKSETVLRDPGGNADRRLVRRIRARRPEDRAHDEREERAALEETGVLAFSVVYGATGGGDGTTWAPPASSMRATSTLRIRTSPFGVRTT